MNFHRDRNLIFLSVLFFAILGSFLLGCAEGTDSSPVGALMSDINNENYRNGVLTLHGECRSPLSEFDHELTDIPVTLYIYNKSNDTYEYVDKTITTLATDSQDLLVGEFKFTGLIPGSYKIVTSKTDTFKEYDTITALLDGESKASESASINKLTWHYTLPLITDEISKLNIKVSSANNSKYIDSATIKIDQKAVNVTNEHGMAEINSVGIGFHDIEINNPNYQKLVGKFKVEKNYQTDRNGNVIESKPTILGGEPMHFCMVEPSNDGSITGRFIPKSNTGYYNPTYVRLYGFNKISTENGIEYYRFNGLNKVTKTSNEIDGTPEGCFKFIGLKPGFYQIYICTDTNDSPSLYNKNNVISSDTYKIYNLSDYDIDISNYRWEPFETCKDGRVISRPIEVKSETTVYWTNIDSNCIE